VLELRGGSGSERIAVERADPYLLQLDNMSAAIRGEAEPLLGRADAVGQARADGRAAPFGGGRPAGRSVTGRLRCAQAVWGCFTEAM
jgi:hypothetical protein